MLAVGQVLEPEPEQCPGGGEVGGRELCNRRRTLEVAQDPAAYMQEQEQEREWGQQVTEAGNRQLLVASCCTCSYYYTSIE
jgi:hypothetical protein